MRPEAVIFDLDGCLVDSEPLSLGALATEMRAAGISWATTETTRDRYLGVTIGDVCRDMEAELGHPCPPDFVASYHRRLFASYKESLRRIDGMVALLDALQTAGVATCIASGGALERIGWTLACADLADRFGDRTFSGEQVARGKPAPDLVLYAAAQLGVAPERCVVIEDSPHGIEGATAAGMRSLGYTGGSHLDGIREAHAARLLAAGAERVEQDASAFFPLLLGRAAPTAERTVRNAVRL